MFGIRPWEVRKPEYGKFSSGRFGKLIQGTDRKKLGMEYNDDSIPGFDRGSNVFFSRLAGFYRRMNRDHRKSLGFKRRSFGC
jgi:hypothetical protein